MLATCQRSTALLFIQASRHFLTVPRTPSKISYSTSKMSKDLDIIIFGATGFTGKHTIPWVSKFSKNSNPTLTWGVAGRSEKKLKDVLSEFEEAAGTSLCDVPVIVANTDDAESLNAMARRARVIINTCGPYRFHGEPVVKACVEEGTHHVDVSGEPQYMEEIQLKYHEKAQEKGIYIISSCGVDSIPSDLGLVFLQQKFKGTVNSVNVYLNTWEEGGSHPGPSFNYATWESMIYGLAHVEELRDLRRKLHPTPLPKCQPRLEAKAKPHKTDLVEGWAVPFPGADRSVVKRSQRYFYENEAKRPVQIEIYFMIKSLANITMLALFNVMFSFFTKSERGRSMLLKYPEAFSCGFTSHQPPSEEKVANIKYSATLYGEGWSKPLTSADEQDSVPVNKAITAQVKCSNPSYGATCISVALSAITVIRETDKLPSRGGVYPPGYAFANTSLIKQLHENGITFEVLCEKDIPVVCKY